MAQQLLKRRGESRLYNFDFSQFPEIAGGDTLTGIPAVAAVLFSGQGNPPAITSPSIASDNKSVNVMLASGDDGTTWRMECTCSTTAGSILVCVGLLDINET